VKRSARAPESSVELPGVSERPPLAFPIDTAPKAEELVFVYSPLRGEWTSVLPLVAGPTNCMLATDSEALSDFFNNSPSALARRRARTLTSSSGRLPVRAA
jgi:hypothetical protein